MDACLDGSDELLAREPSPSGWQAVGREPDGVADPNMPERAGLAEAVNGGPGDPQALSGLAHGQ